VHVQLRVWTRRDGEEERLTIRTAGAGAHFGLGSAGEGPQRHPLLAAGVEYMRVPEDWAVEIDVWSEVPPGCSTGTSASVTVALLGALDMLRAGDMSPQALAMAAYHVEAKLLGRECGVQDQLAAAHGGINLIDVHDFPAARVKPVPIDCRVAWELESRLVLAFVGRSHNSSDVHRQVIAKLSGSTEAGRRWRNCARWRGTRQSRSRVAISNRSVPR
jgi:D-glycero-alpha-D-manno-heptose-7-phosphate kinase